VTSHEFFSSTHTLAQAERSGRHAVSHRFQANRYVETTINVGTRSEIYASGTKIIEEGPWTSRNGKETKYFRNC